MRIPALALCGALLSAGAVRADCPLAPLQQAAQAGELDRAVTAHAAIVEAGAQCEAAQRTWAGDLVALLHVAEAQRRHKAGLAPLEVLEIVERGLKFGRPWPLLEMRAELLVRARSGGAVNWADISATLQAAINDAADRATAPLARPEDAARLIRFAEHARHLEVDGFAAPPRRGDGSEGGLDPGFLWRRFAVNKIAQPIHFVWDQDTFTPQGLRAVRNLAEMLARDGFPTIRLIGHCDHTGPDAYNMELSRRRAEKVKAFLESTAAYPAGRVAAEGRGWHDPVQYAPSERDIYTQPELDQIERRVDLERN